MIQLIRQRVQGVFAWLILSLIAFVFVFMGAESLFSSSQSTTVATIGDRAITQEQWDRSYQTISRLKQPASTQEAKALRQEVLTQLVEATVLSEVARDLGIHVSDSHVQQALWSMPIFQEDGQFSPERYYRTLHELSLDDAALRDEVRTQMALQQLTSGIIQSAFVLDSDVDMLVHFMEQKRDFGYTLVEKAPFENQVKIQPDDVRALYEERPWQFRVDEQVAVEYVELSLSEIMSQMTISEEAMAEFYTANASRYTSSPMVRVAHILISNQNDKEGRTPAERLSLVQAELDAGTAFESVAATYSDDLMSAQEGGSLDWFGMGAMVPTFEQAAFALDVGAMSEPVDTPFGTHLILKMDERDAETLPFDMVKDSVREDMVREQSEERLFGAIESLSILAFEQPNSLEPIADELGLTVKRAEPFAEKGGLGIFSMPVVIEAAFSPEVKEERLNSDMLQINAETFIVLRVTDVIPERQLPLEEVADDITAGLLRQQVEELTRGLAKDVTNALENGESRAKVEDMHGLRWESVEAMTRGDDLGVPVEIPQTAFDLERPLPDTPYPVSFHRLENGDYVVVQLTKIEDGSSSVLDDEQANALRAGLAIDLGTQDFERTVQSIRETLGVSVHPS